MMPMPQKRSIGVIVKIPYLQGLLTETQKHFAIPTKNFKNVSEFIWIRLYDA